MNHIRRRAHLPISAERLESRKLLSAILTLTGGPGNNSFYLAQDTQQPQYLDVWQNSATPGSGTPTQQVTLNQITQVIVSDTSGNNTVTQATFLPMTVVFNGGTGTNTLNISAGTYTIAGNPAATSSNLTINDSGALFFTAGALNSGINPIHLAALNILAGGSVTIDAPESSADRAVLVTSSLSIASTGLLDLTGNDMIVQNTNPNTLATMTQLIAQGFGQTGVKWKGTSGITSSMAESDTTHLSALGIILNNNNGSILYPKFDTQTSSSTDVLIKYTFVGDTNLDGVVDGTDYSRIDHASGTNATGWYNGDFNYDNAVNASDYTLMDNCFNCGPSYAAPLVYQLNNALDIAQEQSRKTVANLGSSQMYPQYVNSDGSLSLVADTHWTAGTWPGLLWNLYQATGNPYYDNEAVAFTLPLTAADTQTSDVGFRIYDSFYPLLQQQPGNSTAISAMLSAAVAKASQYNSTVGAFEAWRPTSSGNPAANFNVLLDLIMDSQLLFWAAAQSGKQSYYNEAVSNAVVEENYLVHADGTSSQFAYFNSSNGAFVDNETYQGYSNTSTWSRGQAWAIYGFAQCYADTGRADFLATSEKTANWFISHLPSDNVPYWDFSDPVIPNTFRDTSAAAVAASGLLKLSALIATSDPVNSAKYRSAAGAILQSLSSSNYLQSPMTADNGVLSQGALNVPANPSIPDNPINFGDYYYTEAINEYLGISSSG